MTKEEMRDLKRGEPVRHKPSGRLYLVEQHFGDRVSMLSKRERGTDALISSPDMTDPEEWERAGTEPPARATLSLSELISGGYLQEVNRLFFHRLGLALMVICEHDGSPLELRIWDARDKVLAELESYESERDFDPTEIMLRALSHSGGIPSPTFTWEPDK